ncbi:MAG TPA: DNA-formamidopyrimidine glycosylase family protein [Gemmatimonadaceae bacterium]
MPELPDILVYLERLEPLVLGRGVDRLRVLNPFVLRTVEPAPADAAGRTVSSLSRLGKRIVIGLDDDLFIVIHLMIAGRLRWRPPGKKLPGKLALAALDFEHGTLFLSEAGSKRRASIHLVRGKHALSEFDRGGLEVLDSSLDQFAARLRSRSHTLKRALTDPRLFSGIGNAYSDEILHAARLSPFQITTRVSDEDVARLHAAVQSTLTEWTERLRAKSAGGFPETVTAFHDEMAVHGKFGRPCPVCGAPVQRIRYADNETNYCARCQTGGRLLADRALSRLLKQDWPRTLEELEG